MSLALDLHLGVCLFPSGPLLTLCPCFSFFPDMECADVPLLTPSSKEMMSQALKATFSGFTKEQQRLGIPKGTLMGTL